ncbi:MAG: presqualene diphosphate synthase HpnD [Pirellulales bacterium]|nr:presqualene diphosphate synthase HpnD [Pirellulales bacterium]
MNDLEQSYALCGQIARRAAKNFYYSFWLLPRPQRRGMCALYAFLRHTDDLADAAEPVAARRAALARWRESLGRALAGQFDHPMLPALADTVARYEVRPIDLHAVLDGVEMDLEDRCYETFRELEAYCERVASAVGLACVRIWGCRDPRALTPARQCGIALQLTNILRDLNEDLARGRVYLPQEDLRRFDYSADDLRGGLRDARFQALMRFEIARAEDFYRQGAALSGYLSGESQAVFAAMFSTYRALLAEIKRRDGDVLTARVRLTPWHKWRIAAGSYLTHTRAMSKLRGVARG